MRSSLAMSYTPLGDDFGMMTFRSGSPEGARCICFPFGGGGPLAFQNLAAALPSTWTVVAVDPPGRYPTRPAPKRSVEELAELYARRLSSGLLDGALLVGHSLGGYVALALAVRLAASAAPPNGVVVSGARPPHLIDPSRPLSRLGDEALFRWLVDLGGIPARPGEQRELFDLFQPVIRADIDAFESYCNARPRLDNTPLLALGGGSDRLCSRDHLEEWRGYADDVDIRTVEGGGHLFLLSHPADMACEIVRFAQRASVRQ